MAAINIAELMSSQDQQFNHGDPSDENPIMSLLRDIGFAFGKGDRDVRHAARSRADQQAREFSRVAEAMSPLRAVMARPRLENPFFGESTENVRQVMANNLMRQNPGMEWEEARQRASEYENHVGPRSQILSALGPRARPEEY